MFPFSHHADTAVFGERVIDRYECAPGISERGPEVHYEVVVDHPGILYAVVGHGTEVDVDVHLLTEAGRRCLARGDRELTVGVAPGRYRLVVDTHGAPGPYRLDVLLDPPAPVVLGSLWNTYYYLANEGDHEGEPDDTPLLSADCDILAEVPKSYHDDLCIEGSGVLKDGRVVNYASSCTRQCYAAVPCRGYRYKICYRALDGERYPWGMGAEGRVLEPDISIAVDRRVIPLGTVIYFPELDGVVPPGRSAPHTGCVRADDVGGAIKGAHFDFFAGTRGRWRSWERIFPTRSWFTAVLYHPRCYGFPGAPGSTTSAPWGDASGIFSGEEAGEEVGD